MRSQKALDLRKSSWMMNAMNELVTRRNILKTTSLLIAGSAVGKTLMAEGAGPIQDLAQTLLPYLQNPSADGMSVCFLAREATDVFVLLFPENAKMPIKTIAEPMPIPATPWTRWKVRFTGLKAGTRYKYQVCYTHEGEELKTETYSFVTLDPQAVETKVAVFNDIHDRRETISALMKQIKAEDFDFSIFNGDMINDPSAADGARKVFELWDFYVKLLDGHSKPIIFVRGNHEVRGSFKENLHYIFDLPDLAAEQKPEDQQWQFQFTAGPVHFVAMDTGEDDGPETPHDSYKRPLFWQAYRKRQAEWLRTLVKEKVGVGSPWRIFISHIPLHNPAGWYSISSRDDWNPLLKDYGVSLMLAGHDHQWKFLPANKTFKIAGKQNLEDTPDVPVLIGGGPAMNQGTVILLHASFKEVTARMYHTSGKLLEKFSTKKALGS
jgi:predicted phosphodiesterase